MNGPTLAPSHLFDGSTSREAAAKVDAVGQFRQVLVALYEQPGQTDDELAERCGLLRHSAGTRRGVGVKKGLVVTAGVGQSRLGNRALRWRLTERGERYVAALLRQAGR